MSVRVVTTKCTRCFDVVENFPFSGIEYPSSSFTTRLLFISSMYIEEDQKHITNLQNINNES